jgi:DNA-binding response OmpR family regulator
MNFWVSAMTATPEAPVTASHTRDTRLTRKERDLLALLMGSPGRVFSRDLLLRTIWGYGEGARTRTVDVHVQRLRRKLGSEASRPLKTIVRAGYCWYPESNQV